MKKQNLARLAYTVLVFALAALAAGCHEQKQLAMCEGEVVHLVDTSGLAVGDTVWIIHRNDTTGDSVPRPCIIVGEEYRPWAN